MSLNVRLKFVFKGRAQRVEDSIARAEARERADRTEKRILEETLFGKTKSAELQAIESEMRARFEETERRTRAQFYPCESLR